MLRFVGSIEAPKSAREWVSTVESSLLETTFIWIHVQFSLCTNMHLCVTFIKLHCIYFKFESCDRTVYFMPTRDRARVCVCVAAADATLSAFRLHSKLSPPSPQHNLFPSSCTCCPTHTAIPTSLLSIEKKFQTEITRVLPVQFHFEHFCFPFRFSFLAFSHSILGHRIPDVSVPLFNVYPASKYALTALSQTIRQELLFHRANIKLTVCIRAPAKWRSSTSHRQRRTSVTPNLNCVKGATKI